MFRNYKFSKNKHFENINLQAEKFKELKRQE